LNTDLIYKAFTFQVGEMCPLFVVGKVRTYSLRHRKDETAVVHVQPKATTHKPIFGIACERAVRLATKVGLIEAGQVSPSRVRLVRLP